LIPRSVPPEWQYYLNPWWREEHEYVTRLDGSECRRRLEASTTRFLGRSVGRAWFSPVDFTLHRVTFYNNGFKPFAYLTFDESQPQQTTVRLTFSGAWSAQVFFGFWYAFMAIFAAVATVALATHARVSGDRSAFAVVPILLIAPFALCAFGRAIASGDRDYLSRFLVDELELRQPPMLPTPIG
jgi:hypothetical protein